MLTTDYPLMLWCGYTVIVDDVIVIIIVDDVIVTCTCTCTLSSIDNAIASS